MKCNINGSRIIKFTLFDGINVVCDMYMCVYAVRVMAM